MAWVWNSWEEYIAVVNPVAVDAPGRLRLAQRSSWFQTDTQLWEAVKELEEKVQGLRKLGFTGNDHDRPPNDPSIMNEVHSLALDAVYAGEELLLHHRKLAESDAVYGFLSQHDMLNHWDRYAKTNRIYKEVHRLVADIGEMLKGYQEFVQSDDRFLVGNLDLPPLLEVEFRLARDLFSVGFDEVGLLIAGRGLEGVLRKIADVRKLFLVVKGKSSPASEADFYDLIETMFQIRWKKSGTRLITPETKTLLHYLRTLRKVVRTQPARKSP